MPRQSIAGTDALSLIAAEAALKVGRSRQWQLCCEPGRAGLPLGMGHVATGLACGLAGEPETEPTATRRTTHPGLEESVPYAGRHTSPVVLDGDDEVLVAEGAHGNGGPRTAVRDGVLHEWLHDGA